MMLNQQAADQTLSPVPLLPPRLLVGSKLMQNYRVAKPVGGEAQVATTLDESGALQIFTVGTNGSVYNVYQDSRSDTGWSLRDTRFPGKAKLLAVGKARDGVLTLVVCDTGNSLWSIRDDHFTVGWVRFATAADQKFNGLP